MCRQNGRKVRPNTKIIIVDYVIFWIFLYTCPACEVNTNPIRHEQMQIIAASTGLLNVIILASFSDVITPSNVPNIEPSPSIKSI